MQNQYRTWYALTSTNQKSQMAENIHKVLVPNSATRRTYKNSDVYVPALLANIDVTVPGGRLSRVVLYNLNDKEIKKVLDHYGNPVPLNKLKKLVLARNGLPSNWLPGRSHTYNSIEQYRRLGPNKYMFNKFY